MQIINPKTGDVMELRDGQWVPVAKVPAQDAPIAEADRLTTGPINAALVGAGDTLNTWGLNARDLWAGFRGDTKEQLAIADQRAEAQQLSARLHQEAPIAAAIGSALPGLATLPLGMGVGAGSLGVLGADVGTGMLARAATNVGLGAGLGALNSQTGDLGADAMGGAAWAGGGMLAGNMVSRVMAGRAGIAGARAAQAERDAAAQATQAAGGALDDAQAGILAGAQRSGMHITPGQALNDPGMRQMEASLASNPVLSPYWQKLKTENAAQLNTLTARAMGVEANNVGADVRALAEHQIGNSIQDVGQKLGAVPTRGLYADLQQLAAEEITGGLPTSEAAKILDQFGKGMRGRAAALGEDVSKADAASLATTDVIAGGDLVKMRSQIAKQMRDAFSANNSVRGQVLADVLDKVDDTIGRQALTVGKPGLVDQYDRARSAWNVLRALDKGAATPDGQVMVGNLARFVGQGDKTGYWGRAGSAGETLQRGGTGQLGQDATGDLYDALRFATSRLGKDIVGDSGTATRLASSGIFEGGLGAMAGRAASAAARRAIAGPLAQRYMAMSPEAAQAWHAGLQQSALAGWAAGNAGGAALGRGLQAGAESFGPPFMTGDQVP